MPVETVRFGSNSPNVSRQNVARTRSAKKELSVVSTIWSGVNSVLIALQGSLDGRGGEIGYQAMFGSNERNNNSRPSLATMVAVRSMRMAADPSRGGRSILNCADVHDAPRQLTPVFLPDDILNY
jgi:hypothetical protein